MCEDTSKGVEPPERKSAAAAPVPAEQRELAEKMAGRIVDLIAEDADQPEALVRIPSVKRKELKK